ncbi:MAG: type II toxin-antitoxin system HicA family toxin [Bacilli bacterium]
MSPHLPVMSGQQMVACLSHFGFSTIGQRGSHRKMRHLDGRTAIIPMHSELAPGTLLWPVHRCAPRMAGHLIIGALETKTERSLSSRAGASMPLCDARYQTHRRRRAQGQRQS